MKGIILRMNEEFKYNIIKELVDHNGNKNRAAKKLNISVRQVNRLIIKYMENGKLSFVHGNRGQQPSIAIDRSISENIILLYTNKYQGFNIKHFQEYLKSDEDINISYTCIYNILKKENLISPVARKSTKKKLKKKLLMDKKENEGKSEVEIEKLVNHEMAIEMDGSIHNWFGCEKACLHLAADKTTNTIVGAYFDKEETLKGYYNVYNQILSIYGIPYSFMTDNRTVFNYESLNVSSRTSEKDVLTQFGYACKILGTELKTSSVAQSKALIERHNGTFQGRLVNEFRLNGITTIDAANEYLNNVFVPKFNKSFCMDYTKFPTVFEASPTKENINYTLAVLTKRKIDNGNAIKFKNKYYQPYLDNQIKCFMSKTESLVIEAFNGELLISIDDKIYELRELSRHERFSKNFDEIKEEKEKKKYIPPMNHPWRKSSYNKYFVKVYA